MLLSTVFLLYFMTLFSFAVDILNVEFAIKTPAGVLKRRCYSPILL